MISLLFLQKQRHFIPRVVIFFVLSDVLMMIVFPDVLVRTTYKGVLTTYISLIGKDGYLILTFDSEILLPSFSLLYMKNSAIYKKKYTDQIRFHIMYIMCD